MKKLLFSVIVLFGLTMTVSAQTLTITETELEALPGETIEATLKIDCDANTYVGFVFSLQFPVEDASNFQVKGLTGIAQPTIGGMKEGKVILTGIDGVDAETQSAIYLKSSTDLKVSILVKESTPLGAYTIQVNDFQLDKKGDLINLTGGTFNINVVNAHTVTLDENSSEAITSAEDVNVKVLRTIKGGNWSTICLPFAMSAEQMEGAFGEVPQVKDFTGIAYDEDNNTITVNFSTVTAMEANHPYIIKISKNIEEFTVENVDIEPDDYPAIIFGKGKGNKYWAIDFIGTYVPLSAADMFENLGFNSTAALFISENKFWYATDATQNFEGIKGFRGFFDFSDFNTTAGSRITMSFDEQTGINNVTNNTNGEYFNLNGLRVETPSKGIYIKDGKKVVVK